MARPASSALVEIISGTICYVVIAHLLHAPTNLLGALPSICLSLVTSSWVQNRDTMDACRNDQCFETRKNSAKREQPGATGDRMYGKQPQWICYEPDGTERLCAPHRPAAAPAEEDALAEAEPLLVAVGSTNPVKVASATAAFAKAFATAKVAATGYDVASGVSDQPHGDEETRTGACTRARAALEADAAADYGVGLEGGVVEAACEPGGLESVAWMAVVRRRDGRLSVSRTASFLLPPRVTRLLRGLEPGFRKLELGDADDVVFKDVGSKRKGGAIAKVTHGLLDRSAYYEHALICALVPFVHDDSGLYDGAAAPPS